MILTGQQIKWAQEQGYLSISDFDEKRLNPNSYNLRLADELMVYGAADVSFRPLGMRDGIIYPHELDMKKQLPTVTFRVPEEGYTLEPGILYLGRTMEYTETHKFVPMLEGRSSVGRLGISIHSTAGFGDIGFCGYWTLEISCVEPVVIYPGVEICQIYYHTIGPDCDIWIPDGDNKNIMKYEESGKYQKNTGIQPSMLWKEFES
ncbi:MAG: dCTP deaminase [Blautia sp.]|nr:dCTP deaminase [Blautia sp.]